MFASSTATKYDAASAESSDTSARPDAIDTNDMTDSGADIEENQEEHDNEDDDAAAADGGDDDDDNDDGDDDSVEDEDAIPDVIFAPNQCLFCNALSTSFPVSLTHMHKKHGLFIPTSIDDGTQVLAVDVETVVQYMHLVVFGYRECLSCHTQRQSPHAVQQHMMGKGHCRVDLEGATSEFRDFYEDAAVEHDDDDDGEGSSATGSRKAQASGAAAARMDEGNLRLASGKVLAHRSAPTPKNPHHRPLPQAGSRRSSRHGVDLLLEDLRSGMQPQAQPADQPSPSPSSSAPPPTQALTRAERRLLTTNKSALALALTKMSPRDRAALAHLTPAERRSTIVGQFKQQDRLRTAERKYWSRMEGMGNQVLMKHFRMDVPGPKLG